MAELGRLSGQEYVDVYAAAAKAAALAGSDGVPAVPVRDEDGPVADDLAADALLNDDAVAAVRSAS